ncbi:MAG: sulfatase-like hydrolase/transferase [Oscillospiraceae bacterium]|nr:sulfatase-like hydrolase/transferase [Oscillospiraceae bacterium]
MKPNVIIINPDQMRADSMGNMGNPAAHTPNLDALAAEGVSFSQAFCQSPVCVPSRCSFMTGLYPHTTGHRTQGYLQRPHEENIFSDMKKEGYFIASSPRGDHLAGQYPRYHKKLIDKYILAAPKKRPKFPNLPRGMPDSDTFFSFFGGRIPTKTPNDIAHNLDDLVIYGTEKFIKNRPRHKPFFAFIGLWDPHPPYQIEQKYYDLIDKEKLPKRIPTIGNKDGKPLMERGLRDALGVGGWEESRLDELRVTYLAMCAKVDDQVGRIVARLKAEGIYDDTAIVVLSDHGDYTGDFGIVEKAQNCFPDCLTNVPLIIKPPKNIAVDSGINNNLVELTDLCSTIADLTGIDIERTHFSKSLLPTMQDKTTKHRDFVCCEGGRNIGETQSMEYDPNDHDPHDRYAPRLELQAREDGTHTKAVMLRTARYKYIRRRLEPDEFYDLRQGERINLAEDPSSAHLIERMQTQLLDWYIDTCDVVPKNQDSRFSMDHLKNILRAAKLPFFVVAIAIGFITLYIKITKQTPHQFMRQMDRLGRYVSKLFKRVD